MSALGTLLRNLKPFKFILTFVLVYSVWYFINEYRLFGVDQVDKVVVQNLVDAGSYILQLLGYELIDFSKYDGGFGALGIDGSNGVLIGNPCNGLSLFVLYSVFIIAYPGRLISKVIAIPLGVLIIHILNIARIVSLGLVAYYKPESLQFNHTYTFTGIMYLLIFGLWYIWVQKFASNEN